MVPALWPGCINDEPYAAGACCCCDAHAVAELAGEAGDAKAPKLESAGNDVELAPAADAPPKAPHELPPLACAWLPTPYALLGPDGGDAYCG